MADCKKCEYEKTCEMPDFVKNNLKLCKTYTPKIKRTNAQKIRSMTDEELAEFINGIDRYDDYAILINGDTVIDMTSCILDWLQSEAE